MHTALIASPSPIDLYLDEVQHIKATGAGTSETSYYPALAGVLNLVGAGLRPVRAGRVPPRRAAGVGRRIAPERGVVEARGAGHSIAALVASEQVGRYPDA